MRILDAVLTWCLGTWFSGGLMVGLNILKVVLYFCVVEYFDSSNKSG